MKKSTLKRAPKAVDPALAAVPPVKYVMRLYVAGATVRSQQAILRAREICEKELKGNYDLEVVDIYQQPVLARNGQILATPTLVKELPKPVRRLIGNLADLSGFFAGLDLKSKFEGAH